MEAKTYSQMYALATPYYEKGRAGDVEHIKWLLNTVPMFAKNSGVDEDTIMAVVLLHDVGYSRVPKDSNPYHLDIRKMHCEEGAKIAEHILVKCGYGKDKISEIKRLILKHDNWAFGDSFQDEPILLMFNNFDFMWMASKKGFEIVSGITKQNPKEFYTQIQIFQRKNEMEGRTWFNKGIKELYETLMKERLEELTVE